jgi:hypothetical protein
MGLEFDKSGSLLSPLPQAMTTVLQAMQKKYGGLMDAQSTTFEGMQSNLRDWVGNTLRALGRPIFDVLKEKLGSLLEFLGSPAVKGTLEQVTQMLAGGIARGMEDVGAAIDRIGPIVTGFFDILTGRTDTVGEWVSWLQRLSDVFGGDLAAQILIVSMKFSEIRDSLMAFVNNAILPFIQQHAEEFKGALIAIGAILAGAAIVGGIAGIAATIVALVNPITLVVAAVGLLGAAWVGNWGDIQGKTRAVIDWTTSTFQRFSETVSNIAKVSQEMFDRFIGAVMPLIETVRPPFEAFINDVLAPFVDALLPKLGVVIAAVGAAIAAPAIIAGLSGIAVAIVAFANPITLTIAAVGLLSAAWITNWGDIQGKTQAVIDWATPYIQTFLTSSSAWWTNNGSTVMAIVKGTWDFILVWISAIVDTVSEIIKAFTAALEGDWDDFGEHLRRTWETIWGFWTDLWNRMSGYLGTIDWNALGQAVVRGLGDGISALGRWLGDALIAVGKAAWNAIRGFFGIESPSTLMMDVGEDVIRGLGDGITSMIDWLTEGAAGIAQAVYDAIADGPDWGALGESIIHALGEGMGNMQDWLGDIATELAQEAFDAIKDLFGIESPSRLMAEQIGLPLAQGIGLGLERGLDGLLSGIVGRAVDGMEASLWGGAGQMRLAPAASGVSGGASTQNTFHITINAPGGNPTAVRDATVDALRRTLAARGW